MASLLFKEEDANTGIGRLEDLEKKVDLSGESVAPTHTRTADVVLCAHSKTRGLVVTGDDAARWRAALEPGSLEWRTCGEIQRAIAIPGTVEVSMRIGNLARIFHQQSWLLRFDFGEELILNAVQNCFQLPMSFVPIVALGSYTHPF